MTRVMRKIPVNHDNYELHVLIEVGIRKTKCCIGAEAPQNHPLDADVVMLPSVSTSSALCSCGVVRAYLALKQRLQGTEPSGLGLKLNRELANAHPHKVRQRKGAAGSLEATT